MAQLAKKKMCDIARLAGVSPSTVSRALNESPLVSKDTRERIKTLAIQNNYTINKHAQDLRRQSSKTISILTPATKGASDPFYLELMDTIANQLAAAGYELLLSRVQPDNWQQHIMAHNYVDGIIILGHGEKQDKLNYLNHLHTPTVSWGASVGPSASINIGSNNISGGQQAAKHLLDQGKQELLFIGDTSNPEIGQRYRGLCEACLAANITRRPRVITTANYEMALFNALDNLSLKGIPFDGIFAASDIQAAHAIKYLTSHGYRVPDDVSVVGYGNTSLSSLMSPAISTISQNITLAGATLVDLLLKQINGDEVSDLILQPKLIMRDS